MSTGTGRSLASESSVGGVMLYPRDQVSTVAAPAFSDGQESDGLGDSIILLYSKVLSLYNCTMIATRYNHSNRVMTTSATE